MYSSQLEAFIKAAELHSFSKAARAAYISPTALIQQVNLLENRLGVTLFDRSHGGVRLTPAGEVIFAAAKQIIRISENAVQQAHVLDSVNKMSIRIGLSTLINGRCLEAICEGIVASHPNFSIEFITLESNQENLGHYLNSLKNKTVDLFESIYFPGIYQGETNYLPLFQSKICIAIPPKHPLFLCRNIVLDDFKNDRIIVPWTRNVENSAFNQAKQVLRVHMHAGNVMERDLYDSNVIATAKLNNIPVVIADAWEDVFTQFRLFYPEWDIEAAYGVVYPLNADRQIEKFIQLVKEHWEGSSIYSKEKK